MGTPLEGIRVVDLSQITSGPFGTMVLAEQGADVVKVESLAPGDVMRTAAFHRGGLSSLYLNHNRGKRSIAVDLDTADGRAIVGDLMAGADVVVQNFRPGVMERLGLGYADVSARNPGVVYVSISGYGPDGPYSGMPVVDPILQALSGVIARQKSEEIPLPDLVRNIFIDKATALTMAQSVCAALFARTRTGAGDHVEIPMLDLGIYFFWPDGMMDHTFLGDGVVPGPRIADTYRLTWCADGQLVYYAVTDEMRLGLFRALHRPELCDDERFNNVATLVQGDNFETLGGILAGAFTDLTVDEAIARMRAEDVPCAPILEPEEVFDDPQVLHNHTIVEWEHPEAGRLRQPRHPVRFASGPTAVPERADSLGQSTDEILAEVDRTPEEIARLRDAGIVG